MNKFFKISIFLTLPFCNMLSAQSIKIANPRFEANGSNSLEIKNWNPIESSGYRYSVDDSMSYQGGYSLKIQNTAGERAAIRQTILLESPKYEKYVMSAAIRTSDVKGSAGCYINVWEGDKLVYYEDMASQKIEGTSDWQIYSAQVFITEKTTKLVLGFRLNGTGTAWFDAASLVPFKSEKPTSKIAKTYFDEAVKMVRENALYRDSVDWKKIEKCTPIYLDGAQTTTDCYPVIRYVLEQLGDKHSSLTEPKAAKAWNEEKTEDEKYKIPFPEGALLENAVGYVQMKRFSSGNQKEKVAFADSLQQLIQKLDKSAALSGWIVDLRDNTGGNCWPMLAGIGPVLGEGTAGYFVSPKKTSDGFIYESWSYKYGVSLSEKVRKVEVTKPFKLKKDLPVAVLIGHVTASSGEVVVASFKNHPRAKLFGEPTGGYSTANDIFNLSDKATMELTTSVYADRKKVHYGKKIEPDVFVDNPNDIRDKATDPVIKEALKWLMH